MQKKKKNFFFLNFQNQKEDMETTDRETDRQTV